MEKTNYFKKDGITKDELLWKLGKWADNVLKKLQNDARQKIKEKGLDPNEEVEFAISSEVLSSFKFYINEKEYSAKDLFMVWLCGMTIEDFLEDELNDCFIQQVVDEFDREMLED